MSSNELLIGFILGIASSLTVNAMTDWMAVLAKAFTYSKEYTDSEIAHIKSSITWQRNVLGLLTIAVPCILIDILYSFFYGGLDKAIVHIVLILIMIPFLVFVLYRLKRSLTILERHS